SLILLSAPPCIYVHSLSLRDALPIWAYGVDFCLQCGSLVPVVAPEAGLALLPAGALALPARPLPAVHIYVASKARWDRIADDWPQVDEMPPDERMAEVF